MPVSYDKLWKMLIDKKMNRTDLKEHAGISFNILAKMGRNEFVSMESLYKVCTALNCDVGDIMEFTNNEHDSQHIKSGKVEFPIGKESEYLVTEQNLKDDLPRDKYHVYREAKPKPVFIYAKYSLLPNEQAALAKISEHKAEEFAEVIVSKDYDGNLFWDFPYEVGVDSTVIDQAQTLLQECRRTLSAPQTSSTKTESERREKASLIVEKALDALDSSDNIQTALTAALDELKSFDEDVKTSVACAAISGAVQQISEMVLECKKPSLAKTEKVIEYLKSNMPKYVYYSNYGNLDSQIYLPQVLQNIGKKDLGIKESAKARTLKTLFKFVKLDPKEITELGAETAGSLTQDQIDGDKPGQKMATELKSDFYAAVPEKVINISAYTGLENGEIEDLFPKDNFARIVAKFLPRQEEVDEDFDDIVVEDKPMCDQIEEFAKTHGITLETGWKVRLATVVKREILKGTDKVISEKDPQYSKIAELFRLL